MKVTSFSAATHPSTHKRLHMSAGDEREGWTEGGEGGKMGCVSGDRLTCDGEFGARDVQVLRNERLHRLHRREQRIVDRHRITTRIQNTRVTARTGRTRRVR
jgi:hypothetical protein